MLEFPRLVYKDGGPHQRAGGTYSHLLVVDQNEYELALVDAWHDNLKAAINAPKVSRAIMPVFSPANRDDSADDRDNSVSEPEAMQESIPSLTPESASRHQLEQAARTLNMRFHPSISDQKLRERLVQTFEETAATDESRSKEFLSNWFCSLLKSE